MELFKAQSGPLEAERPVWGGIPKYFPSFTQPLSLSQSPLVPVIQGLGWANDVQYLY